MPVVPMTLTRVSGDYWWPRWSPDGARLVAGNTTLRVWSRRDGSWREIPPSAPDRAWRMARWRSAEELYVLDTVHATGDPVALVVISAATGTTTPAGFVMDPAALSVNWAEAVRGHWVGVRAADGSLFVDGRRLSSSRRFHGLTTDGHAVLTTTETEWVVVFLPLGLGEWTSPRPPRSNEYALSGHQIVYGDGDRVYLHAPARDVTVAPWGKERLPLLRDQVDTLWLWTASERPDGTPLLLGRPLGAPDAIVIEGVAAKAIDAIYLDGAWHLAAYSDHEGHGQPGLVVLSVPADAPRERLVASPAPPPAPEVWAPVADEVDLWALLIGSGAHQYPRRNPNDPGVYWDVHLARLGDSLEHAWFVKHPNGTVYEWRATWVDAQGVAWIGLIEDHDDAGRTYEFEDPRLMRRYARAGQMWAWNTRLREWDHTKGQWGPWTGPGSDGRFRFRVRVASVERSSYGRLRATIEVDTYQDLEIFELISNKGWSAWEEWRRSLADTGARTRALIDGTRVGFYKRVEWPERYEGPRVWPVRPFGRWPRPEPPPQPAPTPEQPRVTITVPETWPVRSVAPAALRCVATITGTASTITWTRRDATGAVVERVVNPAWDNDHTFRTPVSGTWWISASIERDGRILDATGRERRWIVTPPAIDPPDVPHPVGRYAIHGNFLANGIEPWGFMAPSWWIYDPTRFARFCQAYTAAGYRHLPLSFWAAYRDERAYDLSDDVGRMVALLTVLDRHGIVPIVMLITDALDGRPRDPAEDREWVSRQFRQVWEELSVSQRGQIELCLGWEINEIPGYREVGSPANRRQGHDLIELARTIVRTTGKAPWAHFSPNWWGPHYEGGDEVQWWRDVGTACCGLLAQIRPDAPITLEGDPNAPDGLYLMLRYPRAADGAAGICGRLKALGKRFVLFEHSRDPWRWRQVEAIVRQDLRVDGVC